MGLLADPSAADTHMLRITVGTLPSDIMGCMQAIASGKSTTKLQVMLNVQKLEPVPLALTPAMQLELDEKKAKTHAAHPKADIIPFMFTNGTRNFFHLTVLTAAASMYSRNRPPMHIKSTLSDITELLREAMNMFVHMDKKNQLKLRAVRRKG